MGLNKRERGKAGGGGRGNSICARELYLLRGQISRLWKECISLSYPVSRTTSEEKAEC